MGAGFVTCQAPHSFEVCACVPLGLFDVAEEYDVAVNANACQAPGLSRSIAAVISAAAEN